MTNTQNTALFGVIAVVIILGGAGYFFMSQPRTMVEPTPTPETISMTDDTSMNDLEGPVLSPDAVTSTPMAPTTQDVAVLQAGGSSYLDPKGVFGFLYPSDYTVDTENNGQYTRIFKRGVTQRPQSEMSDGVMIVFESVDLQGKTLSDWVDARMKESTEGGVSEVTQPKKATTLNGYPGFTYAVRGLGESVYTVVQKDSKSNSAVSITSLVADPQQKGYQKEMDGVLSTVKLQK